MSHIVIDARRIRDFGIGTYIRSLVQALGGIDLDDRYALVSGPADVRTLAGLPDNFHFAVYSRSDHSMDHVAFPLFLRGLSPDLVHIPLARVPAAHDPALRGDHPRYGEHLLRGGDVESPDALAPLPFWPRIASRRACDRSQQGDQAGCGKPDGSPLEPDLAGVQRARPCVLRARGSARQGAAARLWSGTRSNIRTCYIQAISDGTRMSRVWWRRSR